ncbi:MAG: RuBisCO large subunit C-terminal-like domain-containing protein, partial [Candidatus Bathyarchaeia archaeon]
VGFPTALFDLERGGIPNLLSIVAGNLFGLSALKTVRLLDLDFPKAMVEAFPGPQFGIDWIRERVGTLENRRPHLGTIVKPKVGLSPKQTAQVAYEAAVGGVDFIKDDETLSDQAFCPLDERASAVMEALDKARSETQRQVFYAVNVTSSVADLLEMAETAKSHGANMLMVNALTAGFSAVQMLAEDPSIRLPLHVHRTMHAAMTRNPRHGIHPLVLLKLVRLAGGDQTHTGTGAGKMEKAVAEVKHGAEFLRQPWFRLKNVFPVASGGVHPGIAAANLQVLGRDCVVNAGGGIHGHPNGTRAGATAMRQAVDAYMQGIPAMEYAKTHEELRLALETWGERYATDEA